MLGVDVSPAMVAATRDLADAAGLRQVRVEVGDANGLRVPGPYDVVTASLVLFFLPDPAAGLARWVSLLDDGGRIGITTFGELDDASRALDSLLLPYAPAGLLDPRTAGTQGPFASAEATADLVGASGVNEVEMSSEMVTLPFADVAAWERFSRTTASGRCGPACPTVSSTRFAAGPMRSSTAGWCGRSATPWAGADPQPSQARCSSSTPRSSASCWVTRTCAVPPRPSREPIEPSTVGTP